MESIVAAYGSSSESSDAASASEAECTAGENESTARDDAHVGAKRKRSSGLQWKRAFPHVDGNWPSHVRIDISVNQELRQLAMHAIKRAQELVGDDAIAVVPVDELKLQEGPASDAHSALHVSLSRPFVLTYDQIRDFVDSLRAALKWRQRYVRSDADLRVLTAHQRFLLCSFCITLRRSLVLLNDDKTRSFLALRVVEGNGEVVQLLRCVDQCLARFGQPAYYQVRPLTVRRGRREKRSNHIHLLSFCVLLMAWLGRATCVCAFIGYFFLDSTGPHSACQHRVFDG